MKRLLKFLIFFFGLSFAYVIIFAAPTYDHTAGFYTDDFSDATGLLTTSSVAVNITTTKLQLTNATNTASFNPPFASSGYAITKAIIPLKIAKWGTLSLTYNTPTNTAIKVQILDEAGNLYNDSLLSGNTAGFTSFPIDLSQLDLLRTANNQGQAKIARIKIKFILETSDPNVTPEIDDFTLTWTTTQGDLATSTPANTEIYRMPGFNNQNNLIIQTTNNSTIYPMFYWKKDLGKETGGYFVFLPNGQVLLKTWGGIISWPTVTPGKIIVFDKDGNEIYTKYQDGYSFAGIEMAVAQNNSLINADYYSDVVINFDLDTGQIKWLKQFYAGHWLSPLITPDGKIIFAGPPGGTQGKIYAYNFAGEEIWQATVTSTQSFSNLILAYQDGKILATFQTLSGWNYTNNGRLYAIDASNGQVLWYRETGSAKTLLVSDNLVYLANDTGSNAYPKNISAYDLNGNLVWQINFGTTSDRFHVFALNNQNQLLVERKPNYPDTSAKIYVLNASNGEIMKEIPITDLEGDLKADSLGGFYLTRYLVFGTTSIAYYDQKNQKKWEILRFTSDEGLNPSDIIQFSSLTFDKERNLFVLYNYSPASPYSPTSTLIAFRPWTMSLVASKNKVRPGETVTISVKTTMPKTNPVWGGENQMQVVTPWGKYRLNYVGQTADNQYLWQGEVFIPKGIQIKAYDFTIEANAAWLKTDIPVNFDQPAIRSENTGLTLKTSFTVLPPLGGGLPPEAFQTPTFQPTKESSKPAIKFLINDGALCTDDPNLKLKIEVNNLITPPIVDRYALWEENRENLPVIKRLDDELIALQKTNPQKPVSFSIDTNYQIRNQTPGKKKIFLTLYTRWNRKLAEPVSAQIQYPCQKEEVIRTVSSAKEIKGNKMQQLLYLLLLLILNLYFGQ